GESVSPLWMVPCEFESKGPDAPLRLRLANEDPQVNPALEYYLRERHKINLPDLPDEPDNQSLTKFLQNIRNAVQEQQWEVTAEVALSTFSCGRSQSLGGSLHDSLLEIQRALLSKMA